MSLDLPSVYLRIPVKIWPTHSHECQLYRFWQCWQYYWLLWLLQLLGLLGLLVIVLSNRLWWSSFLIHHCLFHLCLLILSLLHLCNCLLLLCSQILSNPSTNCPIFFCNMGNTTTSSFSMPINCWYSSSVFTISALIEKSVYT